MLSCSAGGLGHSLRQRLDCLRHGLTALCLYYGRKGGLHLLGVASFHDGRESSYHWAVEGFKGENPCRSPASPLAVCWPTLASKDRADREITT